MNALFCIDKIKKGDDDVCISAIAVDYIADIRPYTPLITTVNNMNTAGKIKVLSIVSPTPKGCNLIKVLSTTKNSVFIKEQDSFINRYTHTELLHITEKDVDEAINISLNGSMSSIQTDMDTIFDFTENSIHDYLSSRYKYSSLINNRIQQAPTTEAYTPVGIISFIDIKNCFPIYDSNNVDGIVMLLSIVDIKNYTHKVLVPFVFTNYRENIYHIDGEDFIYKDEIRENKIADILMYISKYRKTQKKFNQIYTYTKTYSTSASTGIINLDWNL